MTPSLVITIDTEPDNQWSMPVAGRPAPESTFRNTRDLSRLLEFLQARGLKATWLTCWSVAQDDASARALLAAQAAGDEIGAHLHAWETPPFTPEDRSAHPFLYEYPASVQRAKLATLTGALRGIFGAAPRSYRAGRWGIDDMGMKLIAEAGYRIDTSVVPGHDFRRSKGLSQGGPDFRESLDGSPQRPWRVGDVWEVPASTWPVGLLGGSPVAARLARATHQSTGWTGRGVRLLAAETGLCRLVWLRPLAHPARDLAKAAWALIASGAPILNVMFHSSETCVGASPRTVSHGDVDRFYADLGAIADAVVTTGQASPTTLAEAVARFEAAGALGE